MSTTMTAEENREGYARRKAAAGDGVKSEPRIYGPAHPDHSYVQDLALSKVGSEAAVERLERHAVEVDGEIRSGSAEGRRAARELAQIERRVGMSSASTSGGTFVTPEYLVDAWAAYRTPGKTFTNQTNQMPLGDYGLAIHIPSFTASTTVGQQTENQGVSDASPTGSDLTATVVTQAGEVPISQQLYDRGGMTGLAFDKIVGQQLMYQLNTQVDVYVLTQATANAGTVSDATFSIANFYADIAKGREQLTDTAGVRMAATHVFTTSDQFGYITRQVDATTNRPIVTPDSNALVTAASDPNWESWTGIHLPGALRWFTDDNIAPSGSNTQIIVARPSEIYTFCGDPIPYAYVETFANDLTVLVGLRCYVAAVVRFPKCVASISGNAYPTSNV